MDGGKACGASNGENIMNTEQKTLPQLDKKFTTCFCRWDGDTQVQQCTLHKAHIDAIHEWAERARAAETKLKEQRDWEAVAAGRAMTIAMLKSEQDPVGQVIDERGEVDWISFVPNAGTELYASPPAQRKPLTDEEILADEVLRYHFGLNGGAGPVSKYGRRIVSAVERLHEIKGDV
jgi:hypothetical protein